MTGPASGSRAHLAGVSGSVAAGPRVRPRCRRVGWRLRRGVPAGSGVPGCCAKDVEIDGRNRPILLCLPSPSNTRFRRFAPGCQPKISQNRCSRSEQQPGSIRGLGQAPHQAWNSALVTKIGFEPQQMSANPIVPFTGEVPGWSNRPHLDRTRMLRLSQKGSGRTPRYGLGVPPLGGTNDAQAELSSLVGCGARFCRAG
jgi:hypothetical protein